MRFRVAALASDFILSKTGFFCREAEDPTLALASATSLRQFSLLLSNRISAQFCYCIHWDTVTRLDSCIVFGQVAHMGLRLLCWELCFKLGDFSPPFLIAFDLGQPRLYTAWPPCRCFLLSMMNRIAHTVAQRTPVNET